MLRIAVCDEEVYYRERIKALILENLSKNGVEDVRLYTFAAPEELAVYEEIVGNCQIVMIDIDKEPDYVMNLTRELRKKHPENYVVYLSEHVDFAVMGYQVEIVRFLLKDLLEEMVEESIRTLVFKMEKDAVKMKFLFEEGERFLPLKRIMYIESFRHTMYFHVDDKEESLFKQPYGNLKELEAALEPHGFFRVHKSFLVNMSYAENMRRYELFLKTGESIPIPREKYQSVWKTFENKEEKL